MKLNWLFDTNHSLFHYAINVGEISEGIIDTNLEEKISHTALSLCIALAQDMFSRSATPKVKIACSLFIGGISLLRKTYLVGPERDINWTSLAGETLLRVADLSGTIKTSLPVQFNYRIETARSVAYFLGITLLLASHRIQSLISKIHILILLTFNPRQSYLNLIQLYPRHASAYNSLGCYLTPNEKIKLLDGTEMTEQALYLKALDLYTKFINLDTVEDRKNVCHNLATTLAKGGSIALLDKRMVTKQQLLDYDLPVVNK